MRVAAALVFACVLVAARPAAAQYTPPSFAELVFDSPVIVVGRIETLRDTDYDLQIEERIAGAPSAVTLRVRRFQNWRCASRSPPYASGQRLVAFLVREEDGWIAAGGGCEGEVVLDDARALVDVRPQALSYTRIEAVDQPRFISAVRALVSGYREVGAPGYAEAWRGLLRHADPIVVATALERLDAEAVVNPYPASAFAADVLAAVAHPEPGVRLLAASSLERWIGRAEREDATKRLAVSSGAARPELRPAAALARMTLDPDDPYWHAGLIRVLADTNVPLVDREAAAEVLGDLRVTVPTDLPRTLIDVAARDAVITIDDPSLLVHLCRYLSRLQGGYDSASPRDAEAVRAKWLRLLDSGTPSQESLKPKPPLRGDDVFLSPVERAVLVPHDAKNRPLLAKMVRTTRRARNAKRSGDAAAALDAYRDVLSAAPFVDDSQRKVLVGLGIDLDEVGREARALLPDEK